MRMGWRRWEGTGWEGRDERTKRSGWERWSRKNKMEEMEWDRGDEMRDIVRWLKRIEVG